MRRDTYVEKGGYFKLSSYIYTSFTCTSIHIRIAGPRSAVGRAVRGPGVDARSGHILSFLLPLIQEGQLSVTGERMCKKYWLTP